MSSLTLTCMLACFLLAAEVTSGGTATGEEQGFEEKHATGERGRRGPALSLPPQAGSLPAAHMHASKRWPLTQPSTHPLPSRKHVCLFPCLSPSLQGCQRLAQSRLVWASPSCSSRRWGPAVAAAAAAAAAIYSPRARHSLLAMRKCSFRVPATDRPCLNYQSLASDTRPAPPVPTAGGGSGHGTAPTQVGGCCLVAAGV